MGDTTSATKRNEPSELGSSDGSLSLAERVGLTLRPGPQLLHMRAASASPAMRDRRSNP